MTIRRLSRCKTGQVGAGEMLGGNRRWSGVWLAHSLVYVQALLAPGVPEPTTAYSPATSITVGDAEVVDA